jgi:hypothetical protein
VGEDGLGSRDDQVHKANCSGNLIVPTPTRDRSDRWPAIGVNRLQDDRQAYSVRVTGTNVEAAPDLMAMINSPRLASTAASTAMVTPLGAGQRGFSELNEYHAR